MKYVISFVVVIVAFLFFMKMKEGGSFDWTFYSGGEVEPVPVSSFENRNVKAERLNSNIKDPARKVMVEPWQDDAFLVSKDNLPEVLNLRVEYNYGVGLSKDIADVLLLDEEESLNLSRILERYHDSINKNLADAAAFVWQSDSCLVVNMKLSEERIQELNSIILEDTWSILDDGSRDRLAMLYDEALLEGAVGEGLRERRVILNFVKEKDGAIGGPSRFDQRLLKERYAQLFGKVNAGEIAIGDMPFLYETQGVDASGQPYAYLSGMTVDSIQYGDMVLKERLWTFLKTDG